MPVILKLTHEDGSTREVRLPAEVWARNASATNTLIMSEKPVKSVQLDPHLETADTDLSNNTYPPSITKSRFKLFKESKSRNEMQRAGLGKKDEPEKKSSDRKPGTKKPPQKKPASKKATPKKEAAK